MVQVVWRFWKQFRGGGISLALGAVLAPQFCGLACQAQSATPTDLHRFTARAEWRSEMKDSPLPSSGCFKVVYPNTTWQKIACTTAPAIPFASFRHSSMGSELMNQPLTVGGGTDFEAAVTSGLISSASGYFANASGITSEMGYVSGSKDAYPNTLSLQLNSNFYNDPPACSGAANPSVCQGWVQFVVSEQNGSNAGLLMQSWLLNYDMTCPGAWISDGGGDCYENSSEVSLPSFSASQVPNITVTGQSENNTNTATFFSAMPDEIYEVTQGDSPMDLEQNWTSAEFNVFGYGGGNEAYFNNNSSLIVQTSVKNGTDNPPVCVGPNLSDATAETNNLTLTPPLAPSCCPLNGAIQFAESNASGVGASCQQGQVNVSGNFTATPTIINRSARVITHPITEGESRTLYTATLEDSTPGSTITYDLYNRCGELLSSGSVSAGTTINYLNTAIDGQSCTYGVSGTVQATAIGYLQSFAYPIEF